MKVKKYLSLLLAVVMIASVFSTTAFASESELPVNEVIIGGDSLEYRAPNPPTLFYNLGGSGQYTATLIDLAANRGSYTKYYFATSTGEIYLKFDLERSGTTTNKNRELIIMYMKRKPRAIQALWLPPQRLTLQPQSIRHSLSVIISIPTSFTTLGSLTIRTQILRAVWILVVPSLLMIPMFNL